MLNAIQLCPGFQRYEVLNLDVGGYDIEDAAHRYFVRGIKYRPDLILWLLKDDDFNDFTDISQKIINQKSAQLSDDEQTEMEQRTSEFLDQWLQR